MGKKTRSSESGQKLLGNLSVADARHVLSCEGGEQSAFGFAGHIASIVAITVTTGWAISAGHATVWHLVLPMVSQYFALLAALPVTYIFLRHEGLRKDVISAVRLWIGLAAIVAIITGVRAWRHGTPWSGQFAADVSGSWAWIKDGHMQWPMLIAFGNELAAIPGRVRNLYKFGPPFVGVSLGCAMRLVVFIFGLFLLPFVLGNAIPINAAWTLWSMILVAELLTLWMLWSIQRGLRKLDREAKDWLAGTKNSS